MLMVSGGFNQKALRERLAQWMRRVMEERQWSAEQWGARADTSPTNITRFLGGKDDFFPTVRTLAKLASVAGSAPDLTSRLPTVETIPLPLLSESEIIAISRAIKRGDRGMVAQLVAEANESTVPVPAGFGVAAFAVTLTKTTFDLGGMLSGDTVVVDPNTAPHHGSIVATFDGEHVAAYLYHPPFLMPKSASLAATPLQMDSAVVLGVIRYLVRNVG